jgi:hypothetical protein
MKITSFNPLIITQDAEAVVALFEELGFERRHKKSGISGKDMYSVRMRYENEDGKVFHVDVTKPSTPSDMTSIRVNVDSLDEAYEMLQEKGFKNVQGDKITDTGSSRATMMVAPSGYTLSIAQHIKDHD